MKKHVSMLMLIAALMVPWALKAQVTLPYSTGFETGDDVSWTFVNDAPNGWYVGAAAHNSGTHGLYISNDNGTSHDYTNTATRFSYAYRTFTVTSATQIAVSFDWIANGEGNYDYLRAWIAPATGTLTAGQDPEGNSSAYNYRDATPAGWTDLGGKMNLQTTWQTTTGIANVAAGTYRLVFMWANDASGGTTPPAAVDNIIITELSCPQPTALTATGVTASDATLSWTAGGSETEWVYSINNSDWVSSTDNSVTFDTLSANTSYIFKVRAVCGTGDTSFVTTGEFRTNCDMITVLPYQNGFEEDPYYLSGTTTYAEAMPLCWHRINDATGTANYYPYITMTANYAHSGTKGMYWYHTSSSGYAQNEYAILPPIDPDVYDISDLTLAFYARTTSSSYHPDPVIGVMTDPTNTLTFTPVYAFSSTEITTSWQLFAIPLSSYTGTGNFIAIKWHSPGSTCYMAIDDIFLTNNWCDAPTNLTSAATATTVTLNWESNGNSAFIVTLGNDTVYNVTDTSYTFTGLSANTNYNYSVMADCGSATSFAIEGSIRTECLPLATLPYSNDFEDEPYYLSGTTTYAEAFPNCWTRINDATGTYNYYPYINTSSNYLIHGEKSMYWYHSTNSSYAENQYAVLPPIDPTVYDVSDLTLMFYAKTTATAAPWPKFIVGVMDNPDQVSTFVPVDSIELSNVATLYTFNFANYTGNGTYIAIHSPRTSTSSSRYCSLDDIFLTDEYCELPGQVTASSTDTEVTLSWLPNGGTSFTVVLGTDTVTGVSGTSYTFSNLTPNTDYTYSVMRECSSSVSFPLTGTIRTQCAAMNSLPYVMTFEGVSVGSSTNANFVECLTRLNNATTYFGYPYVSSTSGYNHTPGGNKGLYWYLTTTATTYGDYEYVVLPAVDTDIYAINSLQLRFWARATNTSYHPVFQVGVMSNPNDPDSFTLVQTVNIEGTTYSEYTVSLSSFNGVGRHVAIKAVRPTSSWYATMDDIVLEEIPACPALTGLDAATTASAAVVSWGWQSGYEAPEAYVVTYDSIGGNTPVSLNPSTNSAIITGLASNTTYKVYVQADCGDNGYGRLDSITFTTDTLGCLYDPDSLVNTTVGNGTTTNNYIPSYSFYGYGYSQQFFTASEIGGGGSITSITLTPQAISQQRTYEIYMGESTDSAAASFITPSNLTCVYNAGAIPLVAGQPVTFELTTPFNYSGNANLVVIFRDMTGSYVSGNAWYGHTAWTNASRYVYQDGSAYAVPPSGGTASSFRNNITFFGGVCVGTASCAEPEVVASEVTENSVTIVWAPGYDETSWDVAYRLHGNGAWTTVATDISVNTFTFDSLQPSTEYDFRVSFTCSDAYSTVYSDKVTVRTACGKLSVMPFTQDFENEATTASNSHDFIPCWGHLNNGSSYYGYPYIASSATYNHTDGGSKGLYWYGSTSTGSYGDYYCIVLPEIDTVALPINSLMLSFWGKPSSTSYEPVVYIGVMSDPDDIDSFIPYDTINIDHSTTNWVRYTTIFDHWTDTGSYIAIRADRPSSTWYLYMDDIVLDVVPDCPNIEDLTVTVSPTSAIVSWGTFGDAYTGAVVEYRDTADGSSWTSLTVTGDTYATITGLTAGTLYEVRVASVCDDAQGNFISGQFITGTFDCALADSSTYASGTIGTGATQTTGVPVYSGYGNTLCQSIYTAAELLALGFPSTGASITDISYTWTNNSSYAKHFSIYMNNTADSVFNGTTAADWIATGNNALVYSDEHPLNTSGTVTYHLTTPFMWDGHSNLCITTTMNQPSGASHSASSFYGLSSQAMPQAYRTMYKYQDSNPFNGANPASVTPSSRSYYRPNITLTSVDCIQESTCAAPTAIVAGTTTNSVDLAWAPGNLDTVWTVSYRRLSDNAYTVAATGVTAQTYTVTGLNAGTLYEFKIENDCDMYVTVEALTECATITLPFTEDFNNWGTGTGVLPACWYRTGSYSTYTYISGSYNHSGATGGSVYMYSSSAATSKSVLILPELDTTVYHANQTQLVFSTMYTSTTYGRPKFEVGVVSNPADITTFVPVDTVQHSGGISRWETFEVPLSAYTGNGTHVAIRTVYDSNYTYPYVDDITLELIPSCPRPDSLTASNTTTSSIDLSWYDRAGASQWVVEYGPIGFEPGTGTQIVANTNPFTLTGLPSAYQGEYYVKAICGGGDTSEYSRQACLFGTSQVPATLPYDYDFENPAEWANWQTCSNHDNNWFRGSAVADSGSYSMYVSADAGASYRPYLHDAVVNATAFRDIDFGPVDSSYTMTIRARAGGTTTGGYDGMIVLLADPSIATVPSSSNLMTPWGDIRDLYQIMDVRTDTNWRTYTCSFDTIHGVQRVAFYWFNQSTQSDPATYPNLGEAVAVDNIHIDYSTCPRPVNIDTTVVGGSSASLAWDGPAAADYEVAYRVYGTSAATNQFAATTTNSITLSGLTNNTQYVVWVRKLCGVGDTSLWSDGTLFTTTMCDGASEATNFTPGTSSTTTSYGPIGYSLYNYSYVQTIIDSADLAGIGGDITAFGFEVGTFVSNASTQFNNMTVYMANVSESDLSSGFIHPNASHIFRKVISNASFNYTESGWQYHNLDTAFTWDGHSNLLISVKRDNGTYSGTQYFTAHTASASKMRYIYQDSGPYDHTSVSGGTASSTVGDIKLVSCGGGCNTPFLSSISTTYQSANLTFAGNGNSFNMRYGTSPTNLTNTMSSANGVFHITGLTPATQYYYSVTKNCEDNEVSPAYESYFFTDSLPCMPVSGLTATGTGYESATLTWTRGGNETAWQVIVYNTVDTFYYEASGTTYTATGLTSGVTYNANVRPLCGSDHNLEGPLADEPVTFTTDICQPVTGVTLTGVSGTTATISWTAPAVGSGSYRIEYGYTGFDRGQGQSATATATTYTIEGLESRVSYDVYVANICSESLISVWSEVVTFETTGGQGIADVDAEGNLSIYPNPASSMVTVSVSEMLAGAEVAIVDLNGRTVMTFTLNGTNGTFDVSKLGQGAYFVRLTGEQATTVRKLIVK